MKSSLRILHLEDSVQDAELVEDSLSSKDVRWDISLVDSKEAYVTALDRGGFDLILADYSLPGFDGLSALRIAKEKCPETPFILVSGALGEEAAIECLKLGATDYVLKHRLSRLLPCIKRALQESRDQSARKVAEAQISLQSAALTAAANAIVITDRTGRITWVNPAFSKLTGYSPQEAVGQNPRLLKSGTHDEHFYQNLWKTILSGKVWFGEMVNRRKDGTLYTEEQSITPVKNTAGTISHFIAIKQDITERKKAELAMRERMRVAEFTAEVSGAMATDADLRVILEKCAAAAVQHLDAAFARIWTLDRRENILELQASAGMYTHIDGAHGRVPVGQFKIGLIAEERQPHLTNSVVGDPRVNDQEWAIREAMVGFAGYPLLVDGRLVGVIAMFTRQPIPAAIFEAMASAASEIAVGIERKVAEARAREHFNRIRVLHEIDRAITSTLDLQSVLAVILDNVAQFFPRAAAVGIALRDHDTGAMAPLVCRGMILDDWKRAFFTGDSIFNSSALLGPIAVADLRTDPRLQPLQREFTEKSGHESLLVVPIQIENRILGLIGFATSIKYNFSNNEIEFLSTLAGQAAVAIQNAELYQESKHQQLALAERERIQRILKELSQDITRMNVNTVLEKLTQTIREVFNVDVSDVRFLGKQRWEKVLITSEHGAEWLPRGVEFGQGANLWVVTHRHCLAIRDYTERREFTPGRVGKRFGIHGFLAAPLIAKSGEVIGVIRALSQAPREFSAQEIDLFEQFANGAAIAIENSRLYAELEMSNRVKSEFLGVMSHELRTPLNVIMGYANLIKDDLVRETDVPHRQSLQIIEQHANSLLGIIDTIMDATSIESGNVAVDKQVLYIDDLFEQLKSAFASRKQKKIALVWELPDGLPSLRTDHDKLRSILRNLIDNALKFTEVGTVTVSVALRNADCGLQIAESKNEDIGLRSGNLSGKRETRTLQSAIDLSVMTEESAIRIPQSAIEPRAIEFSVRDTGAGIAAGNLPFIFEMFRQADGSSTRAYEGAGLGLYIVKKYSDLLGAAISVESTEGQGSTFTVTLPITAVIENEKQRHVARRTRPKVRSLINRGAAKKPGDDVSSTRERSGGRLKPR